MEDKSKIIDTYRKKEVVSTFDEERKAFLYQREKHRIESEFLAESINQTNAKKEIKILDVACGTGRMLPIVFSQNKKIDYTGLDTSSEMTSVLKEKANKLGEIKNVKIILGDASKMPFKENSFDIVFSYHLLWHLPKQEQEKIIYEMIRVTKKGGVIIFDVLNSEFIWEKVKKIFKLKQTEGIYKLSVEEIKSILGTKEYALEKVLDIKATDNVYRIMGLPNKVRKLLPKNLFHMLYFRVRKG